MEELKVTFQIITPMFLSGADQEKAEFRLASLNGALRYWYRAIDPSYNHPISSDSNVTKESWIFGGAKQGEGQSRFLMRMESHHQLVHAVLNNDNLFSENGKINYFGFVFKEKSVQYLTHSQTVTIYFMRRPSKGNSRILDDWKALLSCIWLLGHLGGLGSRSRRGFGTLALKSWGFTNDSSANQLLKQLPIAHDAETIDLWIKQFTVGLKFIQQWYKKWEDISHTIIDKNTRFYIKSKGSGSWENAIKDTETPIKNFRKKYKNLRYAIGMPFVIEKGKKPKLKYTPFDGERYASPVWIRIIEIKGKYYPFIAVLTPPKKIAIAEQEEGKKETKTMFKHDFSMHDALNKFCNYLNDESDVRWKRCE